MTRILISIAILSVAFISCNGKTANTCDCMITYEITYAEQVQFQDVLDCLTENGVQLTLKNDETSTLICDMEPICPKESRKLWYLCREIDEGRVVIH